MKIVKEAKENLPIDFITTFVSNGWEEVGNLKAHINGINSTFKGTKKVEAVLQELIDAYLIAIGQMEQYLETKSYLELPDDELINRKLNESTEAETAKEQDFEYAKDEEKSEKDNIEKTEVDIELPAYDVEIAQDKDTIEIELEQKDKEKTQDTKEKEQDFQYFVDFEEPELSTDDSAYKEWINR